VLIDVVMPGMSGPSLAQRFQRDLPDVRVLYTSGYTNDGAGQRGIPEPDASFIQKPFAPEALLRKVRELLNDRTV
jgi:two-component system cell cycle sensor histidine kinase/response regulator CckA